MKSRSLLVWGQALDRATGALRVDGATFADLRNVVPRESKLLSRGGLADPPNGDLFVDVTDIVGIFPFRTIKGGTIVGYNRSSRLLTVWRVDGLGGTPAYVGDWTTLPSGAPLPIITGAESYGKMFLAHAEPLYNYRAHTIWFDPALTVGSQLVDYVATLDGGGEAQVRWRGVYSYLSYLVGWGYGSATDPNRPDILRVSIAGEPTNLNKQHYFLAGVRDEPITAVGQAGDVLVVFKKGERYRLVGTSFIDFGLLPGERIYGCITDRLSITIGDANFYWSEQGPRVTEGGASEDLAIPLELDGPEPVTLPAVGDLDYGFVVYDPAERVAVWCFPALDPAASKTRCFAMSLRQRGVVAWSYFEMEQLVYSAGLVIEGSQIVGETPTGYAEDLSASDTGQSGTGRTVAVSWDNAALTGGETVEIFGRPDGGSWALLHSVAAAGGSQSANLTGLLALTDWEIAIRMTKGGLATPGYTSTDPDLWDADTAPDSKTTVTTSVGTPSALSGSWARIGAATHRARVSFTLPELGVGIEMQESDDGVGGWVTVESAPAPYDLRYVDHATENGELGTERFFRLRAVKGTEEGAWSAAVPVWIGPQIVPDVMTVVQTGPTSVFQLWLRWPLAGDKLEVQTSPDGSTGWVTQFLSGTYTEKQNVSSPITLGQPTYLRARYLTTTFGVDDGGPWTSVEVITLTNAAVPSAPTGEDGYWYGPNSVEVEHDAAGGGLGTLYEYPDPTGQDDILEDPDDTSTGTSLTVLDPLVTYVPFVPSASPPGITVNIYHIDTSSGQRKISAASPVGIVLSGEGPSNLVVTQPTAGVPEIEVAWDNGAYGVETWVAVWDDASPPPFAPALGPAVPKTGGDDAQSGPQPGYPSLPSIGSTVKVRVFHYQPGGFGRYSLSVEDTVVLV